MNKIPVLTPEYLLSFQWVPLPARTNKRPLPSGYLFTLPNAWRRTCSMCAEITVLMCERKPYHVWFLCWRKSYPVLGERSLRFEKCCFLTLSNTNDSGEKTKFFLQELRSWLLV